MHRKLILSGRPFVVSATLVLAASVGTGDPPRADLAKIDRTIRKEPRYQDKPRYCLLVFGPEAKTRIWLVQDGDVLYVDRNGNGDLTEDGERVLKSEANGPSDFIAYESGDIRDGGLTHAKLVLTRWPLNEQIGSDPKEWARIKAANPTPCIWKVEVTAERAAKPGDGLPKSVRYIASGDGQGCLLFGADPKSAPIIHFNGPWTLGMQDINQQLVVGKPRQLQIGVGSQGIGPGTFSFVHYSGLIPDNVHPVADIAFPSKSPGGSPILSKVLLKGRC
jgi:hypothetical protein